MPTLTPVDNDPFATTQPKLTPVDHDPFATPTQPGWTDYLLQHLAGNLNSLNPNDPNKPLGQTAFWNKPADVSWGDYAAAHFQPLDDTVRAAANTFGGDRFAGMMSNLTGIGGGDLAAQKAQSEARAKADPSATAEGNVLGGTMLAGPLGEAAQGGRAIGTAAGIPDWLASRFAGATVGGGAVAGGDVLRGDPLSPLNIGVGVLTGGVVGAPSSGSKLPTSPSAQSYFDQAKKAYKPLPDILYDAEKEVHPALDVTDAQNAQRDWSGYKWDDAPKTQAEVNTLLKKPQLSADDVHQAQKALGDVQGNPYASANDQNYARYYEKQLQSVLQDGTPQTGVPANWKPPTMPNVKVPATGEGTIKINGQSYPYADGQLTQPSFAAWAKQQGDFLTGQGKDMERADVWKAVGATTAGKDIGTQAGSWGADQAARAAQGKPGVWAPPGSPYSDATEALAKTTGKPTPLDWYAKHFVLGPLAFTAAAEGVNATTGGEATGHQPWYARLAEELAAGAALSGGAKLYRGYTGAANTAEQQAAEAAVRQTIASRTMQNPAGTYNPLSPASAPSPLRDWVRQFIYSQGAAGKLPGQ